MIRGSLSHLDLTVTELGRSVAFYDQVLGELGYEPMPAEGVGAPCWGIRDEHGGVFSIALQAADDERRHDRRAAGLHHFAFHVDSRAEVDAFHRLLEAESVTILAAPAQYDYTAGYYAVFFADPDGLKLEVVFEPVLRGGVSSS
jgi:catechol 2,3-dioxygenase-like lactoylglutathione lyase family enzyme